MINVLSLIVVVGLSTASLAATNRSTQESVDLVIREAVSKQLSARAMRLPASQRLEKLTIGHIQQSEGHAFVDIQITVTGSDGRTELFKRVDLLSTANGWVVEGSKTLSATVIFARDAMVEHPALNGGADRILRSR